MSEQIELETVLKMNEKFIQNIVDEEWDSQIYLFREISKRNDLYTTILSFDGTQGTFANDNKEHLLNFIKEQFKKAKDNNCIDKLFFSVAIRQFTDKKMSNGIPEKNVAMCAINKDGIIPFSKKEALEYSTTCYKTGKRLPKEKGVNYCSFNRMLENLNLYYE